MQGLILLVLLTDSHEGGGGTAFVRGSHRSIIRNGFRENAFGEESWGMNQDLNNFAQQIIQDQTVSGDLYLSYEKPVANLQSGRGKEIRNIEQIVGKKGELQSSILG